MSNKDSLPAASFDPSTLPIGQLESAKSKIAQIMESIVALQRLVEAGGQEAMPAWPDILTKYNVLLSQTYNLSTSLISSNTSSQMSSTRAANGVKSSSSVAANSKPLARLALHPFSALADAQLDNDLAPLLRNQQTTDVLRYESATVRRLAERLPVNALQPENQNSAETYTSILQTCETIREEHDLRCDRAVRAVNMLREKYDWKARVAVEVEEPEDFVSLSPISPKLPVSSFASPVVPLPQDEDLNVNTPDDQDVEDDDSRDDDAELEEVLGPSLQPTPGAEESPNMSALLPTDT